MSDNNFTPPEVVWIDNESLRSVALHGEAGLAMLFTDSTREYADHSFTLTSYVDKAKREAVRNALSELRQSMADNTEINGCVRSGDVYFRIDKLLSQYQEPTTE